MKTINKVYINKNQNIKEMYFIELILYNVDWHYNNMKYKDLFDSLFDSQTSRTIIGND